MQIWLRISLLLCAFGFFREMRPSEPFSTEYLSGDRFGIGSDRVNKEIYPFGTYAVLAQLVIVFLITDMLRYKPIIVLSACAGIVLFGLLIWSHTVIELQIAQVFYGTFMASEVAYYTYIYAKVEKERYQIVTGHTRAAILCGKFLGGVLAQVLVSTGAMNYWELNFISFGSQLVSLCIAIALPSANKSLYFYTDKQKIEKPNNEEDSNVDSHQTISTIEANSDNAQMVAAPKFSCRNAMRLLVEHAVSAYSKPVVVQWSIWWALATSGQIQAISYVQFLWKEIDPNHESVYNGAVEAIVTLLGAAGAMTAGLMKSSRHTKLHWWILTVCSLVMGTFLIISAYTQLVIVAYIMYILFGLVYFFVITIASATVAENLSDDSFGLIFGINTLVALALQTLLTVFVVTDAGFGYGPRDQYIVYGGYFIALAVLYGLAVLVKYALKCGGKDKYIVE